MPSYTVTTTPQAVAGAGQMVTYVNGGSVNIFLRRVEKGSTVDEVLPAGATANYRFGAAVSALTNSGSAALTTTVAADAPSGLTTDQVAGVLAAGSTTFGPLPSGTPTLGQVPVVTTASPLALGWGGGVSRSALGRLVQTPTDAALLRWKAALALAAQTPVNVQILGHSMAAGFSATSYVNLFGRAMQAELRRLRGFDPTALGALASQKPWSGLTDWPITAAAPTLAAGGYGAGGYAYWVHSTLGAITVNVPIGHTSMDIWTGAWSSSGIYSYAVDGGAATNVNNSGDPANSDYRRKTNVTLNPATSHTVVLTGVSGGYVPISEVVLHKGDETNGIYVRSAGAPGATAAQVKANLIDGSNPWTYSLGSAVFNPALLYVVSTCNNYYSGAGSTNVTTSAQWATDIVTTVNAAKALHGTTPSVVLGIEWQRNNVDGTLPEPWQNYVDQAYTVAAAQGWAVHDMNRAFGGGAPTAAVTAGLINADTIHPADAGAAYWGMSAARFLLAG